MRSPGGMRLSNAEPISMQYKSMYSCIPCTDAELAPLLPQELPSFVGKAGSHVNSSLFLRDLPEHVSNTNAPVVRQGVSGVLHTLSALRWPQKADLCVDGSVSLHKPVPGSALASASASVSAPPPFAAADVAPATVLTSSAWFEYCHEARSEARRLFSMPLAGWCRLAAGDTLIKARPWVTACDDIAT